MAAFKAKIEDWYLVPGRLLRPTWDHAFALMSIDCLLIDALSQYYYGALTSSQSTFRRFAKWKFPAFRRDLPETVLSPARVVTAERESRESRLIRSRGRSLGS